ncbi:prepilin-type N-terminal cleavage/methylation domain-containing protein [Patescibacteria group bacterium]|nr:prepilin-type N-terminal cleavage/methylation domain-containing protein [Patescibacteria group bacterium]
MFLRHIKKDATEIPRGSALTPIDRAYRARSSNGVNSAWFRAAGFSLLEVMVAIFIIIMGLVVALLLVSRSTYAGNSSAQRLIAANLAQEGIEVVKNMRDVAFVIDLGTWDVWHAGIPAGTNSYSVQYNSNSFGALQNNFLKFDAGTGLYSYDSGADTPFKREIILTKFSDNQLRVVSRVTWSDRNQTQSIIVEDMFWNWR